MLTPRSRGKDKTMAEVKRHVGEAPSGLTGSMTSGDKVQRRKTLGQKSNIKSRLMNDPLEKRVVDLDSARGSILRSQSDFY